MTKRSDSKLLMNYSKGPFKMKSATQGTKHVLNSQIYFRQNEEINMMTLLLLLLFRVLSQSTR
jgi:hypothetical protein